ncbi:MAG: N-acetylglucosamine-6-phosphate deacetylase [Bacteroidota bacterium]
MSTVRCYRGVLLKGGTVLSSAGPICEGVVLIEERRIAYVGKGSQLGNPSGDYLEVDAPDGFIVPGFVDIHVHGAQGHDTMDGTYEALNSMSEALVEYGVTSFLPTTVTEDQHSLREAARAVAEACRCGTAGAEVLGMHLEGPFINVKHKGAQNPKHIRLPDTSELEDIMRLSGDRVRLVTLAPEMPGALEAVAWLADHGVTASVGHSDATLDDVEKAMFYGLRHVTHTFNGMRGFHHREPGVVGAALAIRDIDAEVIADMVHVHPAAIRTLVASKGVGRVILITDAISATGMPDGEYELGGLQVTVAGGVARLREGNLAGSTLTMIQAIRNMVSHVGVTLDDAIQMATINPARAIGVERNKGSLTVGKDGDVVVLDDGLNVHTTVVQGEVVYQAVSGGIANDDFSR